jgi:hypothetical protein
VTPAALLVAVARIARLETAFWAMAFEARA